LKTIENQNHDFVVAVVTTKLAVVLVFQDLADIFAEVHLIFLMSYFLLEAKVNRPFVFPFHLDIVGTKLGTEKHPRAHDRHTCS